MEEHSQRNRAYPYWIDVLDNISEEGTKTWMETAYSLKKLFGVKYFGEVSPEHYETLKKLAGPHGKALYKAMLARGGPDGK